MLDKLVERLNKDANAEAEKTVIAGATGLCEKYTPICKVVKTYPEEVIIRFKDAIDTIPKDETIPVEMNSERFAKAVTDPETTIAEAVVSTQQTICMDKKDYDNMIELLSKYNDSDDDKKAADAKIISFIKAVNKSLRKANDDKPADSFIIAIVDRICRLKDISISKDVLGGADTTEKYRLALKVNAICKKL